MLPKDRKCHSFYLRPHKSYENKCWFLDKPVGANTLRDIIKELCKKGGFEGFFQITVCVQHVPQSCIRMTLMNN